MKKCFNTRQCLFRFAHYTFLTFKFRNTVPYFDTFGENLFLQLCHAKTKTCFLHGIAADCRHTLKKFPIGGTKKDFGEKIIFCKMYVEIWAFDSTVSRSVPLQ